MILLAALLGIATGWLINLLSDYLLRFRSQSPEKIAITPRLPAVIRLATSGDKEPHFALHLASELLTGIIFALLYTLSSGTWQTVGLMAVCAYFILIMLMDLKYRVVLNALTYPAIVLALVLNLVVWQRPILNIALGIVFAFGIFYVTSLIRPNGLGGGDTKLAALMGAMFGFPLVLWALIASAAASAIVIAFLLLSHRRTTRDTLPYAPFLCFGSIVVLAYIALLIR